MPEYLLLLRGGDFSDVPADDLKDVYAKYMAYAKKLREENRLIGGNDIKDEVTIIKGAGDDSFAHRDAEMPAHDKVGGYFLFSAANLEAAIDVADECPHNLYGGYMELREING
ncbi:MAG: YciI family protein [Chthonomonadales bacterium]